MTQTRRFIECALPALFATIFVAFIVALWLYSHFVPLQAASPPVASPPAVAPVTDELASLRQEVAELRRASREQTKALRGLAGYIQVLQNAPRYGMPVRLANEATASAIHKHISGAEIKAATAD